MSYQQDLSDYNLTELINLMRTVTGALLDKTADNYNFSEKHLTECKELALKLSEASVLLKILKPTLID